MKPIEQNKDGSYEASDPIFALYGLLMSVIVIAVTISLVSLLISGIMAHPWLLLIIPALWIGGSAYGACYQLYIDWQENRQHKLKKSKKKGKVSEPKSEVVNNSDIVFNNGRNPYFTGAHV